MKVGNRPLMADNKRIYIYIWGCKRWRKKRRGGPTKNAFEHCLSLFKFWETGKEKGSQTQKQIKWSRQPDWRRQIQRQNKEERTTRSKPRSPSPDQCELWSSWILLQVIKPGPLRCCYFVGVDWAVWRWWMILGMCWFWPSDSVPPAHSKPPKCKCCFFTQASQRIQIIFYFAKNLRVLRSRFRHKEILGYKSVPSPKLTNVNILLTRNLLWLRE